MSTLLEQASLVLIPSGYAEDKVYSVIPSNGSGDLSFTRASDGTRINSDGLVENTPWNLMTFSEQFNDASWSKASTIVGTNVTTAPNGTLTADKLALDTGANPLATNSTGLTQNLTVNSGIYTYSIYLKAAERNIVRWRDGGFSGNYLVVNLTNGTFTNGEPTRFQNVQVISVGNEWYQVVFTTGTITNANAYPLRFGDTGQTGDGVSGGFAWGAQLNIGSTAKPYFPTTDRLNVPRLTYQNGGGGCPSLLLEPQRTNLATNSDGILSTYATNVNVTNATSSFNSFINAIQFPSTGVSLAYKSIVTTVQTYCISVFIKMDDNSVPILSSSAITGNLSLVISGVVVTNNLLVENFGNNVYRLSGTATSTGANNNNGVLRYDTQVLKSFKITGIQLEAGSYATSYIPTVASSATRIADACSKTGISSLIGQSEGTIFVDVTGPSKTNSTRYISVSNGTDTNRILLYSTSSTTIGAYFQNPTAGAVQPTFNTVNGRMKIAIAYKNNDLAVYMNGTIQGTVSSYATAFTFNFVGVGTYEDGTIANSLGQGVSQAILFKTRLTNSELATLTTI